MHPNRMRYGKVDKNSRYATCPPRHTRRYALAAVLQQKSKNETKKEEQEIKTNWKARNPSSPVPIDQSHLLALQRLNRPVQLILSHHDGACPGSAQVAHLDTARAGGGAGAADQATRDAAHDAGALEWQVAKVEGDGDEAVGVGCAQ